MAPRTPKPPPKPPRGDLTARVVAAAKQHPDWTHAQLAADCRCSTKLVQRILSRHLSDRLPVRQYRLLQAVSASLAEHPAPAPVESPD